MRLACPNCDAKYEVPDDAIPEAGRDVQCSSCGHAWFQLPPEVEAAAEEEAALYGDDVPLPAPAPMAAADADLAAALADAGINDPLPEDDDTPGPGEDTPAAAVMAATAAPAAQVLEDSVLAVLREEAERETEARRQEAQRAATRSADAEGQMQVQPDLGVEAAAPAAPALSPTQRRLAMLKGEDPDAPPPAPSRPAARRDLLPDVEEINSTLQPSEGSIDPEEDVDALPDLTKGRSGFRTGFLLMIFVLGVAAIVYVSASSIAATIPALEGAMTGYVAFVDGLRVWLDDLMTSASDKLNPA